MRIGLGEVADARLHPVAAPEAVHDGGDIDIAGANDLLREDGVVLAGDEIGRIHSGEQRKARERLVEHDGGARFTVFETMKLGSILRKLLETADAEVGSIVQIGEASGRERVCRYVYISEEA